MAVVGAGGIGFDVSEFLITDESPTLNLKEWKAEWGVGRPAGGTRRADDADPRARRPRGVPAAAHEGPAGQGARQDVGLGAPRVAEGQGRHQLSGVNYERIDDDGLHISFGPDRERPQVLEVDNVVICAGQEPVRELDDGLRRNGIDPHVIGGADVAAELDAKRAIKQGTELAARL